MAEKRPRTSLPVASPTAMPLLEGTPMLRLEEAPIVIGIEVVEISLPSPPASAFAPSMSPTQAQNLLAPLVLSP